MYNSIEADDLSQLKSKVKRKVATAEGGRRNRTKANFNVTSTRWDTLKPSSSPKGTFRGAQDLCMYRDDYYEKKYISPGFKWNTTYIGQEIKDNSLKPSAPKFTIGRAPRENVNR